MCPAYQGADRATILKPAPRVRRPRKRVGRGEGSGTGKTAGRGQKGWGSRSGAKRRARFEGGQNPDSHADAQAARPAHEEVDAVREVPHPDPGGQPDRPRGALRLRRGGDAGGDGVQGTRQPQGVPVKVLAKGEISKPLTVHAHGFSKAAREQIEGAGGTCQ